MAAWALGVVDCISIEKTLTLGGVEGGRGGSGAGVAGWLGGGKARSNHAAVQSGVQSNGALATPSVSLAVMSVRR